MCKPEFWYFFLAFQPLSFLKRSLPVWHNTPMYRACINRSGCNISITETPIKIVQWLLGQSVTPNKKKKPKRGVRRWEGKITLDECQLNEQTAKNKHKQTSALAMVDTHTPLIRVHIYLYEYVRAARKCSHTRTGSHILISSNLGIYPGPRRYAPGNWYCLPERVSTLREQDRVATHTHHSATENAKWKPVKCKPEKRHWWRSQRMHKQATSDY